MPSSEAAKSAPPSFPSIRMLLALLLAPILIAYSIMAGLAVNLPHIDDYPTLLGFALHFEHIPTVSGKLSYIVGAQYLEYKFVFMHCVVACEVGLTHHLSFVLLGFLGNLFLLPLLYLLWKTYFADGFRLEQRLVLFLPVAYVLFSLNYGEGLDWPSSTLDYFPSIYFALASLYLLCRKNEGTPRWTFAGTCVAALLAYFSAGNSFLLGPIGFLFLLSHRNYRKAMLWLLTFAIGLSPYFYHFVPEPRQPGSVLSIVLFFVSFVGSAASLYKISVLAGLLVLGTYVQAWRSGYYRSHPAAVLGATWLIGSGALAAVGRSSGGFKFSYASRYQIFSNLLFIFCYAFFADRIARGSLTAHRKKQLYQATLAVTFLFWVAGDLYGAHILAKRRALLRVGMTQYLANPTVTTPLLYGNPQADRDYYKEKAAALRYMNEAIQEDLYRPPAAATTPGIAEVK